jgi:hypothetical protein
MTPAGEVDGVLSELFVVRDQIPPDNRAGAALA